MVSLVGAHPVLCLAFAWENLIEGGGCTLSRRLLLTGAIVDGCNGANTVHERAIIGPTWATHTGSALAGPVCTTDSLKPEDPCPGPPRAVRVLPSFS